MKLQDQVCSLEHAKKLIALGIEHPDDECIVYSYLDSDGEDYFREVGLAWNSKHGNASESTPLFTVGELGAMLSAYMDKDQDLPDYLCNPDAKISDTYKPAFIADMLIGLIEGKYLTVDEANERLAA